MSAQGLSRLCGTPGSSESMPRQRPPQAKQHAAPSRSHAANSAADTEFVRKLHLIYARHDQIRRGCRFCGHECFEALRDDEQGIMDYRRSLRMLPKAVQDRDLLWIFGGAVDEPMASAPQESSANSGEQTSPTASSDDGGPMAATSPSGSDHPSQPTGPH